MPPQAYDPVQTVTNSSSMDPRNPHMNQQPPMYTYSAYAPTYHGHSGFNQNGFPPPPPPPGWGAGGWGQPQYPPMQQQPPAASSAQAPVPAPQPYQILEPHGNDVLMGRGGKNNQHVGNERLRDMARSVRDRYKASQKKGKSNMSRELVQKIRELDPPGRFLKRNPITNEWEDVGDEIAREKVSQVLRDAVSEWTGPKSMAKEAKEREEDNEAPGEVPGKEEDKSTTVPPDTKKPKTDEKEVPTETDKAEVPLPAFTPRSTSPARTSSRSTSPVPAPAPAPMPVIEVPATAVRTVTETAQDAISDLEQSTPLPSDDGLEAEIMRDRLDTAESDSVISFGDSDGLSLPEELEESSESPSNQAIPGTRRNFRRMPVQHVPYTSFRNKRKTNLLDRYSNTNMGLSSSDMSISTIGSQLSSRNLGTQLSSRQLMSTGARQMSSRQLSSRTLSSRQLSSRQLSSRQLSSRQLSSRQLSSRQLSNRGLMSMQQRKQNFAMMGESDLSLDALSISGHSRQLSRKNVFMEQYMAMDMGLSDFSLGSLPEMSNHNAGPSKSLGGVNRPSVIIEGDLENELSEHGSSSNLNVEPSELLDMYAASGVGTSISNMTMNTIGTFSGHSRMSKGLYATGNSMRLESGHSFLANDLQLDMLDDELFDEYDYMDDADEFSSEFC